MAKSVLDIDGIRFDKNNVIIFSAHCAMCYQVKYRGGGVSKMADQTKQQEKGKSVSFTFSKKKAAQKLVQTNKEYRNDESEAEADKDFIHSAEEKVLKRYIHKH